MKLPSRTTFILLLLLAPSTSFADPTALRHAGSTSEVVVEGGSHDLVAGVWLAPSLGVGLDVGTRGQAVGVHVAWRHSLAQGPRGWGVHVFAAGGVRALLADPGVALTVTPAIAAGSFGKGIATLGLAVPVVARIDRPEARLPVLAELNLGARPGPISFGVRGAMGPVFVPTRLTAIAVQWSAWLTVSLPNKGQGKTAPATGALPAP